ncbi:MAG: hypothetical protein Q8R60_07025 [Mycobacteriales bacterium]|nr:hypothetical protein [Mycobacteriales bacterium]
MSKQRQRDREARQAARAAEVARAAKARERKARVEKLKPTIPPRPPKQKRFGALPTRVRLSLAVGWLATQFLVWQVFPETRTRIGFAIMSLAALPLVVVLTRDTATRRRL